MISFYVLPVGLVFLFFLLSSNQLADVGIQIGKFALSFLVFILFAKPFSLLLPSVGWLKQVISMRRELGVATFYLAFFHVLMMLAAADVLFRPNLWAPVYTNWMYFGLGALVILFLMYVTSNTYSVRLLKRNWKRLHRLAYVALLLALLHAIGIKQGPVLSAIVIYVVYISLRFFVVRRINRQRSAQA
jgi:sulfoxide reductase heme-binding subunit YedZ